VSEWQAAPQRTKRKETNAKIEVEKVRISGYSIGYGRLNHT
jgi:hypothetical protein